MYLCSKLDESKTFVEHSAELLTRVMKQKYLRKDIFGTPKNIYLDLNKYSFRINEELQDYSLSNKAESQLLQIIKIPAAYLHRCPHHLQEENFNYWANYYDKTQVLFRVQSRPNTIRAIVSPLYNSNFDNYISIPIFINELIRLGENEKYAPQIMHFIEDEDSSITELSIGYPNLVIKDNDRELIPGTVLINSETGQSALHIRPIILVRMLNNIYRHYSYYSDGVTTFRHIGSKKLDKGIMLEAIEKTRNVSEIGIARLLLAEKEFTTVKDGLNKFCDGNENILTTQIISIIEDEYKEIEQISKMQLVRSIYDKVKDLPAFKQHEIHIQAGKYLDLFHHTNDLMANLIIE